LAVALTLWNFRDSIGIVEMLAAAIIVPAVLGACAPRADRPVGDRSGKAQPTPRLTASLISEAMSHLGIAELNKALAEQSKGGRPAIQLVTEIARCGKGWRTDLDLPPGVTATDIIDRRSRLASGLRRALGTVWTSVDPDEQEDRTRRHVTDSAI